MLYNYLRQLYTQIILSYRIVCIETLDGVKNHRYTESVYQIYKRALALHTISGDPSHMVSVVQ